MLFWSSVTFNPFWTHFCLYTSSCVAQQMLMSPCFTFKTQAFTHLELRTNAVKHQQKLVALYLGVECYSLHADNLNTFYLIHPSHGICDLHWLKQNGGYCWLYKIRTENDCNFTHYKIAPVVLYVTNDLNQANTKEFKILIT